MLMKMSPPAWKLSNRAASDRKMIMVASRMVG
jgi:hypothetical protein